MGRPVKYPVLTSTERQRTFYRIRRTPKPWEKEGQDKDEWCQSLREARARRAALVSEDRIYEPCHRDPDMSIERVTLVAAPKYELAWLILNRVCFIDQSVVIVPRLDSIESKGKRP